MTDATATDGLLLAHDPLLAAVMETESKRMQLSERLPFFLSGAEAELTLLVEEVRVRDFSAYNQSRADSEIGAHLEAATRRLLHRFWRSFATGNAAEDPRTFNGLGRLITPGQTLSVAGHVTLADLARLVAMVKAADGRPHVLWTSAIGVKNIQRAYFEAGLEPEYVMVSAPDLRGGFFKRPLPSFQGIPIHADDFHPAATDTSVYAMALGRGGLFAALPATFGTHFLRVKEILHSTDGQTAYRVYWPTRLVLERADALACVSFAPHPSTT